MREKITIWFNLTGPHNKDFYNLYQILGKKAFHQYIKACVRFTALGRQGVIPIFTMAINRDEVEVPKRIMISFYDEEILNYFENIDDECLENIIKGITRCCMGAATIRSLLCDTETLKVVDIKALIKKKKSTKKRVLTPAQQIKMRLAKEGKLNQTFDGNVPETVAPIPANSTILPTQTKVFAIEEPVKAEPLPMQTFASVNNEDLNRPNVKPVLPTPISDVNIVTEDSDDDDILGLLEGLIGD